MSDDNMDLSKVENPDAFSDLSLFDTAEIPHYKQSDRRDTITLNEEQLDTLLRRYALISAKKTVDYMYYDLNRRIGLTMTSFTYKLLGGLLVTAVLWLVKNGVLEI